MTNTGFTKPAATWNEKFDRTEYIFGEAPNEYLASHAAMLLPGQRALAVADGEGRNSVWCAQQGLMVDAFDLSPIGIAKAKALASDRGIAVNFFISSCEDWDWMPEKYDVVLLIFVQFATPELRAQLFAHCIETLKPGGLLILQGYTPKQLEFKTGGPPILAHLYTETMLREALASMDILDCSFYEREIREGTHHVGMSALCGVVARKRTA